MLERNIMLGGAAVLCAVYAAVALTPNEVAGNSDSDRIEAAIAQTMASGENEVLILRANARTGGGIWPVTRAMLVPSSLRLVLDDCLVRLAPRKCALSASLPLEKGVRNWRKPELICAYNAIGTCRMIIYPSKECSDLV